MTVQPTEQCVQTFLRTVSAAPGGGGGPASALRTLPSDSVPSVARPPAARPERRRKSRRSRLPVGRTGTVAASGLRRASRCVLLISTVCLPLLRRIAVHPVEGLNLGGVSLIVGLSFVGEV